MKKYARQSKILELIKSGEIETQEDLAGALKKSGIEVTQATVSRDIRELKLVKVAISEGRYKYHTMENNIEGSSERLIKILKSSMLSVNTAENMIIIKTIPGAAQISASAIDTLGIDEVLGTIAGDDTIFIAVDSKDMAIRILKDFNKFIK